MIKNTLLSILILFITYILLVFLFPGTMYSIANIFGIQNFNNNIIKTKNTFDEKAVNIPSGSEFISGAIDVKNGVVKGVNQTKEKIDYFRLAMSGVTDTYNSIKNRYNNVNTFIDSNSGKLDTIRGTINDINDIKNSLNNTGVTN